MITIRDKIDFGNDRMRRWIEKLMEYDFIIEYLPGDQMGIADQLSRGIDKKKLEQKHKRSDAIKKGKLKKHMETIDGVEYWTFDDGRRCKIPKEQDREKLIEEKHLELGHRGFEAVYYDYRKEFYWPGMKNFIIEKIKHCETCSIYNRKNKLPPQYIKTYEPLQQIGVDIMEVRRLKKYVIVGIDYYTRIMVTSVVETKTTEMITNEMKNGLQRDIF